jgi:hypothetical protein
VDEPVGQVTEPPVGGGKYKHASRVHTYWLYIQNTLCCQSVKAIVTNASIFRRKKGKQQDMSLKAAGSYMFLKKHVGRSHRKIMNSSSNFSTKHFYEKYIEAGHGSGDRDHGWM